MLPPYLGLPLNLPTVAKKMMELRTYEKILNVVPNISLKAWSHTKIKVLKLNNWPSALDVLDWIVNCIYNGYK